MYGKTKRAVSRLMVVLMVFASFWMNDLTVHASQQQPSISYTAHVQNIGWQPFVKDGGFAGTEGKSYRVEGIIVKLDAGSYTGSIKYRSYIQGIGWQGYMNNGSMTGTNGQSKRLEAIRIELTGDIANYYDVYYTVHAQNYGWLAWAKNGETSGTVGYGYRLEGIMVKLVKKGEAAPSNGKTDTSYEQADRPFINYMTYVQNEGWKESVRNGGFSGSLGKAQRIESINISVDSTTVAGGIQYRAMIQGNSTWTDYVADGNNCGTTGYSKRLEAIQIEFTGELAEKYDVSYRTYVENRGWLAWVKNGETSGTIGKNARIEAIQIQPVEKSIPSDEPQPSTVVGKVQNACYYLATNRYLYFSGADYCQYEFSAVENAVKYEIFKCEYHGESMDDVNGLDWKKAAEINETKYQDHELPKEKSYLVKVRAVDSEGKVGEWSDVFEVYRTVPTFDIQLSNITANTADISWTSDFPSYQVISYEIRLFKKSDDPAGDPDDEEDIGNWVLDRKIKDIPKSQNSYSISELSDGTEYLAKIDAIYQVVEAGIIVKQGSSYMNTVSGGMSFKTDSTQIAVTGISLNKTNLTLVEGNSETLSATISPGNATDKTVTWSCNNTSAATVDGTGKVTAVKAGTATITATSNNGKTASCSVTVNPKTISVTGISITNKQNKLALDFNGSNNSYQCHASVAPSNATNKNITWTSSDSGVATVSSTGLITAKARGIATIKATTSDGGFSDSMQVYVYKSGAAVPSYGSDEWLCFQTRRDSSYVMDAAGAASANGTQVLSYSVNNSDAQLWRFRQKTGGYDIYPKCSGDGQAVLDVNRGGNNYTDPIKEGLKIDLWKTGVDDAACTWILVRLWDDDNGTAVYIIKMANYDYAVAVDSLGGQLALKKFDVNDVNQKWTVRSVLSPSVSVSEKIVQYAQNEVGYKENPATCWTKYTQWYLGRNDEVCPEGFEAWCAMFVSYIQHLAGDSTVSPFCNCGDGVNKYSNIGMYKNLGYVPKPGDIVFFTDNGAYSTHVGIVEYVENGILHTIEGNTLYNGEYQVARWQYNLSTGESQNGSRCWIFGYGVTK